MSTRRTFLIVSGVGLCALAAPATSFAQPQPARIARVGFLAARSRPPVLDRDFYGAFPRGMRELGYIEGKNLVIEWRFAEGDYERLPALAAELVKLKVNVIVAAASPAIRAAQQATTTIPIVFPTTGDPVGSGFVASLARPGGNITGLSNVNLDVSAKLVELMVAVVPKLSRVAVLGNPGSSTHPRMLKDIQRAGESVGVRILPVAARTPGDIERAFSLMASERVGAVIIASESLFIERREQIATLAGRHRLPSITQPSAYVDAGGLMAYGSDPAEGFRRAATYVDKILKGARPGDLPVEQPTKFELVVNLKAAKMLGITIPPVVMLQATRVIE